MNEKIGTQNWLFPIKSCRFDGIDFIENEIVQEPDTTKTLF